jgi:S-phase kinase-associated protein 1
MQVVFISNDGRRVGVSRAAADMSVLAREMLRDDDEGEVVEIPMPNVSGAHLERVAAFCERHAADPMPEIRRPVGEFATAVGAWDLEFATSLGAPGALELLEVAHYMDVPALAQLLAAKIASDIAFKSPEEIGGMFGVVLTPEDEERARRDHPWCEELRL